MNLVIFASDSKGTSSLNSIIHEANSRGINVFAMVCQNTQLKYPTIHKNDFQCLSNCDNFDPVYSDSLGVQLPFNPDWLLIQRERWEPETSIIQEFKQKFNSKIGLVEPNCWLLGNAESRLEIFSKNRFKNLIDVFFVHSTQAQNHHNIAGFEGITHITGNPKYDINLNTSEETISSLKSYYKIDDNKEQVLLFSLINEHRDNINNIFKQIINDNPDKQYFYKPYPGEPFDPKFRNDYYPKFFLDNCTPILEENHIWGMFDICHKHIGCISSIIHATLLKNKKYVDLSLELGIDKKYLDFSGIYKSEGAGIENNIEMWLRSLNVNIDGLNQILSKTYNQQLELLNKNVWDNLDNPQKLLTLFDDFNDSKANKRIINYILNHE